MNGKSILGVLIVLLIVGVGAFVFLSGNSPNGLVIVNDNEKDSVTEVTQLALTVTSAELSKHNSQDNCWVIYKGDVYDITSFLPNHPGTPEKVAPYCGNDGFESAFAKKHGTSKATMFMKLAQFKGELI